MLVKIISKKTLITDAILLALVLSSFSIVGATTYQQLSIEEILERSDIAYHGQVTAVDVELLENAEGQEQPWTKITFDVLDSFKGEFEDSHSLYFFGGVTDSRTIEVEGMPSFRLDEELLIFAYDAQYYSPLVGFSQGLFRLDEDAWQSEASQASKWLGLEEDKFVLVDERAQDSKALIEKLKSYFSAGESSNGEGQ